MAIRADSYGSVDEILAFTRHLLDGQEEYNQHTRPRLAEVEKFIDRASGILNTTLEANGITSPVTNSTAKLAMDDWVVARAVEYAELTQRGAGYSDAEGSRINAFRSLNNSALDFVTSVLPGLKNLGVTVGYASSNGLAFTGMTAPDDRLDPDDSTLAQPKFKRGMFNAASDIFDSDEE